jgi:gamma-glutamyltranspeptidase
MNRTTDKAHSGPAFYDGVAAKSTERRASHVSVIDAQELMVSVTTYVKQKYN